ncbi:MAG: SpoIIE family protein phosphatase [Spirochaetaceae bacterium]|jgi:serine phosphatase RsbU (regulator of sigma subunit)|nr:SpoIIE family protein phosphatase [Spirochaetaceae bacterium]
MYQTQKRVSLIGINIIAAVCTVVLIYALVDRTASMVWVFLIAAIVFTFFAVLSLMGVKYMYAFFENQMYHQKDTRLLYAFVNKLRFAYTVDDLIEAVQKELEDKADCSVLLVSKKDNYVVYNSPDTLTCEPETLEGLTRNFSDTWPDGYYFIDEKMALVSNIKQARGFFIVHSGYHLYVFCRYTWVFDMTIFPIIMEEFVSYQKRAATIRSLTGISELAKEWTAVADTQQAFLPAKMPKVKKLDIAPYFRPLVNVSGDYYHVIPIDEDKTLLILGDVSGKGLAAALVMGIILNTLQILDDKEDLPAMIYAVDKAIKGMHLQDKYTVLFMGIADTKAMKMRYINASMSDPLIVGYRNNDYEITFLPSNCSVIGIIDLEEDLEAKEVDLHPGDLIFMASDGVSEPMDDNGVELGNTELYVNTIKNSSHKSAAHFINDIADLVLEYNGDKKLRDDVTMLVAKVER